MDNFLLQSLLESTGAQLAFSNGWRYGAPIVPGQITLNDLYNIIPMNPPVSTVELTGEEIKAMLEENLERTFSCDPYEQMGGSVKRCLGLNVYFKIENPSGNRIQKSLYVLFKQPELFNIYYAGSPAIGHDTGILINYEKDYASLHKDLNARLFMSVGGTEDSLMVSNIHT